jgi:phosphoserine aminotransferase
MRSDKLKINFNAGPAALPIEVMQQASDAILNYNNTGLSILSIPHRGKLFADILEESKQLVKELCHLNDDYEVLWMHGGGRLQFSMIPMNFLAENDSAGYIDSGYWAHDAIEYAKYYGNVMVLSSSKDKNYTELPPWPTDVPEGLAYLHFTTNNTIFGTQWKNIPKMNVPLIADMSSDIFSKHINYTNCDMFYAVAQKNIGAVGATLVVVKKDMLNRIVRDLPPMLNYRAHAKHNSILNTSPIFAIYTALLMLRWTKQKGIDTIERENDQKAEALYAELHRNSLFQCDVKLADRSMMNVCFKAVKPEHEEAFVQFCEQRSITGIKGHRSAGAFRVSLYNAITIKDVEQLIAVMQEFEKNNKQ